MKHIKIMLENLFFCISILCAFCMILGCKFLKTSPTENNVSNKSAIYGDAPLYLGMSLDEFKKLNLLFHRYDDIYEYPDKNNYINYHGNLDNYQNLRDVYISFCKKNDNATHIEYSYFYCSDEEAKNIFSNLLDYYKELFGQPERKYDYYIDEIYIWEINGNTISITLSGNSVGKGFSTLCE